MLKSVRVLTVLPVGLILSWQQKWPRKFEQAEYVEGLLPLMALPGEE